MRLHFLFGRSGAGKTRRLLTNIAERSIAEPERQFIVLVPEQFTSETQRELLHLHPGHATLNIDVLSFARLAHRVFSEVGVPGRQMLGEVGKSLLLERIALEMAGELGVLGHNLTRPGSIAQMKSMVSELLLYGITPEELYRITGSGTEDAVFFSENEAGEYAGNSVERTERNTNVNPGRGTDEGSNEKRTGSSRRDRGGGSLFSRKIFDIAVIYERFLREMGDRFLTAEEVPDVLANVAERSALLSGAVLALDGFTGFTPVQYVLLKKLLLLAGEVTVAVTIDPEADPFGKGKEGDLFSLSRETVRTIAQLAREAGATVTSEAVEDLGRFREAKSLVCLEKALFRRKRESFSGKPAEIHLLAAPNPLEEVREAARVIAKMVRESNTVTEGGEEPLRYRDFAIITGDLAGYGSLVRQVFGEMEIPVFVDEKRSLLRNPLLAYVRGTVQLLAESFSTESVVRVLRSGLTGLPTDTVDRLENYILGAGLRGKKRWHEPITRPYRGEDPNEVPMLEAARQHLLGLLDPLAEAFARRKGTVAEKAEALYDFLVRSGVEVRLAQKAAAFAENGRSDLAREYRQVYARVLDFLERLVQVLGEEAVSIRDFRELLEAGLAEEKIAIIPPGTDQVLVGDMERSRLSNVKVLFFLGVNEGLVPKQENGGGLLSEADRELLAGAGIQLKPTARENISISRFYMYLALTKPSRCLFLSYAEADSAGSLLRPSYLVAALRGIFPEMDVERPPRAISERIERPANAHSLLVEGFSELSAGIVAPAFLELFAFFKRNRREKLRLGTLLAASARKKPVDAIGRAAARAIYGDVLLNSASRLEQFAACEFAQFVRYGLKLQERAEYQFTPMDMGNVVHDALERYGRDLAAEGLSWTELDREEQERLLASCLRQAAAGYGSDILEASPRNAYQVLRMERLLRTSVWAMTEQLRRGEFRPVFFELGFQGEELSATTFDLGDGVRLELLGRIDRVDLCEEDGETFLKIMDYKTGSRAFDLPSFYYGLQLQLMVYLGAARELLMREGRKTTVAGIFYYEIKDPVIKTDEHLTEDEIAEGVLKEMRASGLVAGERETLLLLDRSLSEGGKSLVIPAEITKTGQLSRNSKAVTAEQFELLLDHAKRKLREFGTRIMAGAADVNPYRMGTRTACDYCSLRDICGFDPKIGGYRYRNLPSMKTDEVLAAIEEETYGSAMDGGSADGH